jgi:hypothetical protein
VSERQEQLFGGVPAWLLADYLVDLGGKRIGDDVSRAKVGRRRWTAVARRSRHWRVTVTFDGRGQRIMQQLRRRRSGGG